MIQSGEPSGFRAAGITVGIWMRSRVTSRLRGSGVPFLRSRSFTDCPSGPAMSRLTSGERSPVTDFASTSRSTSPGRIPARSAGDCGRTVKISERELTCWSWMPMPTNSCSRNCSKRLRSCGGIHEDHGSSPLSMPRMALSMSFLRSTSRTYWRSTCP